MNARKAHEVVVAGSPRCCRWWLPAITGLPVFWLSHLALAQPNQWTLAGSGFWNSETNWSLGIIPNAPGASVLIGPSLAGPATITLGSLTRVGDLTLNSGQNISIFGPPAAPLIFERSLVTSEGLLAALGGGSHLISMIGLESHLNVDVDFGTILSLYGVYGNGRTIRKTGDGLLHLDTGKGLIAWNQGLWHIEAGEVRFELPLIGDTLGGAAMNTARLRMSGGMVTFAGAGSSDLRGAWEFDSAGGTVNVLDGRTIHVYGVTSGDGALTKSGGGTLSLLNAGKAFFGDFRLLEGTLAASSIHTQQFIIRGEYLDAAGSRLLITGGNTGTAATNLTRALTFENGRTNQITVPIHLASGTRGGIAAAGPGTVVEVQSLIQSADAANQNLYLSSRNGGVLVLGANARVDSYLDNGRGRTSQYSDDGTGQLRLAPGFLADEAPANPAIGWSGLDVFGGTLVSSESGNLPAFLRFQTPRFAAENRWTTEFSSQQYDQAASFLGLTRILTGTDLQLSRISIAPGVTVTKDGPGTLVLTDPAVPPAGVPAAGARFIHVAQGTLQFDLTGAEAMDYKVDVATAGTLSGTGRMGDLTASGVVAPGRPGQPIGTLSALSLDLGGPAPGTFAVELGASAADVDRISVLFGDVILTGASLTLNLLAEPTMFIEYVIVDKQAPGPVQGAFAQGAFISADFGGVTYPFDIIYNGGDGNDVVLMLVPEPGVGALALLGAAVWGALRRRPDQR